MNKEKIKNAGYASLAIIGIVAMLFTLQNVNAGKYSILVNANDGTIISAGFTDFNNQAIGNLIQIKDVGDEIPGKITTHYFYNMTSKNIEKRDIPLITEYEKGIIKKDKTKQKFKDAAANYTEATSTNAKIDALAAMMVAQAEWQGMIE